MNIVIMGCGRVGATLASLLDADGHTVTVMDTDPYAFRRLTSAFRGTAMVGNGLDQDDLRRAGIEDADAFAAVTQGDNRNVMACQIAKHIFNVKKSVCRIYDPARQETYKLLGLDSICPTIVGAQLMREALEI
jgi:trk system potassium uptake protein TrkA